MNSFRSSIQTGVSDTTSNIAVEPNSCSSSVPSIPSAATIKRASTVRSLQPRAAAAMDFNDNESDEEDGGLLSADYKAQRKTTQDLVDFFKSAPPSDLVVTAGAGVGTTSGLGAFSGGALSTATSSTLLQGKTSSIIGGGDDEKKKKSILQRLRPKKSAMVLNNNAGIVGTGSQSNQRNSLHTTPLPRTNNSNVNTVSGNGGNKSDVAAAAIPNGKKYIMIAVDYNELEEDKRDKNGGEERAVGHAARPAANSLYVTSRRQSQVPDDLDESFLIDEPKRASITSNQLDEAAGASAGVRRSIVLQGGALGDEPFPMHGLSSTGAERAEGGATSDLQRSFSTILRNSGADNMPNNASSDLSRGSSTCTNKVTFCAPMINVPLDEGIVSEALVQRIASHKAKQQQKQLQGGIKSTSIPVNFSSSHAQASVSSSTNDYSDIILPKPVSRKKVRHVQIQTQHCIMRPVHTQTEPIKDFVCDLEPKAWVCSSSGLISHHSTLKVSCDAGTSTSDVTSLTQASSKSCSSPHKRNCSCGGENSNEQLTAEAKTAVLNSTATSPTSPVSPFISSSLPGQSIEDNNINTGTNTSPKLSDAMATATINADSTPTSMSCTVSMESNEIVQLRQQNALLQAQLASLQRDLVAETRARMRTVIAMQDTREKFEMLSAMAYKKLKEMIFQRHVLEMKVRELRAQVDVQSSQGGMLLRHEQMQLQQLAQFQYQAAT